jgi:hypothetical protein
MKLKFLFVLIIGIVLSACGVDNSIVGCGVVGETCNYATESALFEYWAGEPDTQDQTPIRFDNYKYNSFPIKVFKQDGYLDDEVYQKAFRFWADVAGKDVFILVHDGLPEVNNDGILAVAGDPDYVGNGDTVSLEHKGCQYNGTYGKVTVGTSTCTLLEGTEEWRAVAHELGHALGFGHSGVGNCVMVSNAPGIGCDLSVLRNN